MKRIAPEIDELADLPAQRHIIDVCMEAIMDAGDPFWGLGRGAGKSTVRALLAARLLADEECPLYKVVPIARDR
jgi:hypothetical protein